MCDRESDILALMQRAQTLGWPVDLVVRSQHNRVLADNKHLWDEVDAQEVLGEIEFTLGARDGRKQLRAMGGLGSVWDWGQVLLVAIGKQHSLRAKPHSESRQASGKT